MLFVCENNQYAMSTPTSSAFKADIAGRAAAYGMPGVAVDGNDFVAVFRAVSEAAARAREGEGPTLVESHTYRIKGHSRSDRQAYRTRDEVRSWQEPERDPVTRYRNLLVSSGALDEAEADEIRARAKARVREAVAFADASPRPDPARVAENVYA